MKIAEPEFVHSTKLFELRDLPRLIELLEYRNRILRECLRDGGFADAMVHTNNLIKQYLNLDATK